jgi:hypothetical protein
MQIFVDPSDLLTFEETVRVGGTFDDGVVVAPSWMQGLVRLSLPGTVVQSTDRGMTLSPGWREENKRQLLSGEATNRIDDVFNEHSQLNANAEMNELIRDNGTDQTRWTLAARNRASEIDRCWHYVNEVRETFNRLMTMAVPANPTADNHWPSRIQPFRPR